MNANQAAPGGKKSTSLHVLGLRAFPRTQGGVERHCEELYPRLDGGMDVTVYRRRRYVSAGGGYPRIRFVDLPSTGFRGFETVFHSFLATLRAVFAKPDLVHVHNIGPGLFSFLLRWRGIPMVLTYHSPNYEHAKWGWFGKLVLRLGERVSLATARRIIFVNRFQMVKYPEVIQSKSEYIPNGIGVPEWPKGTACLEKFGLAPRRYVLTVGRITPEKGLETLIRGFRAASHAGFKLVIAGESEFEDAYLDKLRALAGPDVVFTGSVFGEDLAELYANAALFVLASNDEGFPLVLLEAMSYGLGILVSDIPAAHLVDLEPGDYFPRGDAVLLSGKIAERLAVPPRTHSYDLSGFDWDRIADATMQVYRKALGRLPADG